MRKKKTKKRCGKRHSHSLKQSVLLLGNNQKLLQQMQKQMVLLLTNHQEAMQQMIEVVIQANTQLTKIGDSIDGLGRIATAGHF